MPSVDAYWSGKCPDPDIQETLCRKLKTIAELSHSYFKDKEPIKFYDREITGDVLIDSSLVKQNLKCKNVKKITYTYTEKRDEESYKLLCEIFDTIPEKPKKIKKVYYVVKKARLYGIEFLLFDPRGRDYGDRVSFVFLRIDNCEELNGKLVLVEDRDECKSYYSKKIQESDWFLTDPYLHLRYFCEKWTDRLMQWVKYFYVPNLKYWRYDDLPEYEKFSNSVDHNYLEEYDTEKMSRQIFISLINEYREEVRAWIARWGLRNRD